MPTVRLNSPMALCGAAVKIGRPGYRVTKQFNQENRARSLLFQVELPACLIPISYLQQQQFEESGNERHLPILQQHSHAINDRVPCIVPSKTRACQHSAVRPDRDLHMHPVQVEYPEIDEDAKPRHRFMSSYEQKKESWDKRYQFLLFAAEPYEVIAFKVPNMEVEHTDKFFSHWCAWRPQSSCAEDCR